MPDCESELEYLGFSINRNKPGGIYSRSTNPLWYGGKLGLYLSLRTDCLDYSQIRRIPDFYYFFRVYSLVQFMPLD